MSKKTSSNAAMSAKEMVPSDSQLDFLLTSYDALFEQASDAVVLWDTDMKITGVNRRAEEISGLKRKQLIGQSVLSILEEDSVKVAVKSFREMMSNGKPVPEHVLDIKCVDGTRQGEVTSAPMKIGGEIVAFQTVVRDVTERKKEHDALLASEAKLRAMFESVVDAITVTDLEGNIIDVNMATVRMYGAKEKSEMVGRNGLEFLDKRDHMRARESIKKMLAKGHITGVEYTAFRKDGTGYPVEISGAVVRDSEDNPTGFVSVAHDISTRKQAQEALLQSEEKLRATFDSIADAVFVTDLEGKIIDANDRAASLFGLESEEAMVGKTGLHLLAGHEQKRATAAMKRILETGISDEQIEYAGIRKDGTEFPIEVTAGLIEDPSGQLRGFVTVAKDISKRKEAEKRLAESEERFRVIFDTARDGILLAEPESKKLVMTNAALTEMLGYTAEEIVALSVEDIHPRESLSHVVEQFEKQVKKEMTLAEDIPLLRKDGSTIYADVNSAPITLGGKTYLMGVFRDITARKHMEEQVLQSQRLESLGMFAAGLAQDLKEYISKIFGHASFLKNSVDSKSANYGRISELVKAAQEVTDLADRLITFSGRAAMSPTIMSVDAPINETMRVLRRYVRPNVNSDVKLDARPGMVKADYWQMQKAILSILTNACDVMPAGGTLKVRTRMKDVDERMAKAHPRMKPGPHVVISISDTGTGMSREVLERIFDPFFTTKGSGKGAGLGLSVAYGIVKDHKGTILVRSRTGKGSTFDIYLPAAKESGKPRKRT